jgi:hypothetical protein
MTIRRVVVPAYEITCDGPSCVATYPAGSIDGLSRMSARAAGWLTRPGRGKGSRSAPDLCPDCRPREPEAVSRG